MSNYTKSTDFTAKDSLPSGDSQKVIRGSEFDTEFSAIATAVNSKADKSGDTIVLTAGTVSAPSLTTVGDTNTGIYFPAADKVAIATGGTERAQVTSGGNFLLGTTTEAGTDRLNVVSSIRIGNASTETNALQLTTSASSATVQTRYGTPLIFGTNATERMRLDSSGNLGIGTTPSYKLDVSATGTEVGRFKTSGAINALYLEDSGTTANTLYIGTVGNDFRIVTSSNERLRLDSSGNLGLGVTPSAWSGIKGIQIGDGASFTGGAGLNNAFIASNAFYDGTNWKYINNNYAYYESIGGAAAARWYTAPSGTAGNTISFTQAMTLDASGNLGVSSTNTTGWTLSLGLSVGTGKIRLSNNENDGADTWILKYSRSDDSYTAGIKSPSYQSGGGIAFVTGTTAGNETERVRIAGNGNVGIGTNSILPNIGLELKKAGAYIALNTTTTGFSLIRGYDSGTERWGIGQAGFGGTDGLAFYTSASITERARITGSGDFLVGTTATTGSQTNTKNTVVGKITSNNGTVSAANNTATTILSVSAAGSSTFLVTVTLISVDVGSYYTVLGLLRCGGNTDNYTNIITATNLTVSLNGSDLQVTQTSGLSGTVTWSLLRLI